MLTTELLRVGSWVNSGEFMGHFGYADFRASCLVNQLRAGPGWRVGQFQQGCWNCHASCLGETSVWTTMNSSRKIWGVFKPTEKLRSLLQLPAFDAEELQLQFECLPANVHTLIDHHFALNPGLYFTCSLHFCMGFLWVHRFPPAV